MSRIHPVQQLLNEHRTIESVLDAFEAKLLRLPAGPFPGRWFFQALDFFRRFVEGCHHNREEEIVFPQLRVAGLLEQHDSGAEYLQKLQARLSVAWEGDLDAIRQFRRQGLEYVRFLREHISQEDEILNWAAAQPASEEEINRMQQETGPEHFHQMPLDDYQKYLNLAAELCVEAA